MSEAVVSQPTFFHDQPGVGFVAGVALCECGVCRRAVVTEGRAVLPVFAVRTEHDRLLVEATLLAEAMAGPGVEWLFYVPGDRLVEITVSADRGAVETGPQRWWSEACTEDDDRLGRQAKRSRVPRKQSKPAQESRQPGWTPPYRRTYPPAPQLRLGLEAALAADVCRFDHVLDLVEAWARPRSSFVSRHLLALVLVLAETQASATVPVLSRAEDVYEVREWAVLEWLAERGLDQPVGFAAAVDLYTRWLCAVGLVDDPSALLRAAAAGTDPYGDDLDSTTGTILPWPASPSHCDPWR